MILIEVVSGLKKCGWKMTMAAFAFSLVACAPMEDEDSVVGSHLTQPPAGTPLPKPVDAGDIAIVGQEVAHAIMDLPVIASATVPPLVQFRGVTSIVDQPVDTDPYTELLRDRLLLLTRQKLRFVEHTLPPYVPKGKKKKVAPQPSQDTESPDYEILAELRGHADADFYKIQVQFVDLRSNQVLFDSLYRIRPEAPEGAAPESVGNDQIAPPPPTSPSSSPSPSASPSQNNPPPPTHDLTTPTTTEPAPTGENTTL
jgi:hypothetical protein